MRTLLCLVFALSVPLGCHAPAPFDAATDCPKEAYCGQCASRGGCAWCGDSSDSGKGQCVAVGHSECAAPSAWSKTPDLCPAPPDDAGASTASTASTAAPESESPMKKAIGREKFEAIRAALIRAFPQATVNDEVVDGVAHVLMRAPPGGAPAGGGSSSMGIDVAPITRKIHEKEHPLYLGYANHHRIKSTPPASQRMESEFTLALPLVRLTLPEKLEAGSSTIATAIGDVDLSRDHLLGSVDLIHAKYGGAAYLGQRPGRVDLITPARVAGARFGAMAVYLGYRRKADRAPSFYMLEAGTATGDAKMIYFSPDMKPIQSVTSNYLPTPFVSMRNTYSGGLTMMPSPNEGEPAQLVIHSHAVGDKDPYITVTINYKRSPTMDAPLPIEITANAAARVALIAKTMGIASAIQLQPVLADLARTLHWHEHPRYVTPAAPIAPVAPASSANPAAPR